MIKLRFYQREAIEETMKVLDKDVHPVISAPVGVGKTFIMAGLIEKIIDNEPTANVLVLADDKRLLEQNKAAIEKYFEGLKVGLCSAGLNSYVIKKITVAGIQSIHRKAEEFKKFNYVIIDECHTINTKDTGIYRKFLGQLNANYIGLSATIFRTGQGYIHQGKNALFNKVSYDMSTPEIYNRIVEEGYLSELFGYPTALKLSGEGCKTTKGDWDINDLAKKNDREHITEAAILESVHYGKNYKCWLVFAINIDHANNIVSRLNHHGVSAIAVHSKTENLDQKIADYKSGKYRAAVHVNMLVKGFDHPMIDLIIDMRPTKSPIIHVQGKGRGTRPVYADGYDLETIEGRLNAIANGPKPHCLVLDFAGNVERLGPINYVQVQKRKEKKGKGQAITKRCPTCNFLNWGGAKFCVNCAHEFEFEEKLSMKASSKEIVKKKIEKKIEGWVNVDKIDYQRKAGRTGKPDYMQVIYHCGMQKFYEPVCIDHKGYPKYNAQNWIHFRWKFRDKPKPKNLNELMKNSDLLARPHKIKVKTGGRYTEILDAKF